MKITNGTIKIKNRRVEIYWLGQYATHVMEEFIKNDGIHNFTHQEIQNSLRKSRNIEKIAGTKRGYRAFTEHSDGVYVTIFILTSKQAVIRTNYFKSYTMEKAKKGLKLSMHKKSKKNNPGGNPGNPFAYKVSKLERKDLERLMEIDRELGLEVITIEQFEKGMEASLKKSGIILKD